MTTREPISKRRRFEVFKRDMFTCQYCGRKPPDVTLEIDHVVPVAGSGDNNEGNLVTACFDCNRGKADRPLNEAAPPIDYASRTEEIQERRDQLREYEKILAEKNDDDKRRAFEVFWKVKDDFINPKNDQEILVPKQMFQSVKYFLGHLTLPELEEAIEIAFTRKPYSRTVAFKYFCGICWNKIKRQGLPLEKVS